MYVSNLAITNFFQSIKNTFEKLSTNFTVELALYLFIGLIFGFLFKYTSKYVISSFIIIAISLWSLESLGAISINYCYIKELLGLSVDTQAPDLINYITSWIQNHISQCLSSGLGFYLAIELL